jgi:hypothetical protein
VRHDSVGSGVAHIAFCFSLQPCSIATPLIPQWHHKRGACVCTRGLASSGVGALCRTHARTVMIATSRLPRKMLPLSPFLFEKGTIVCPFTWCLSIHAKLTCCSCHATPLWLKRSSVTDASDHSPHHS